MPARRLDLGGAAVDPELTFTCGQAFRWSKHADGAWIGVALGRVWRLRFTPGSVQYQAVPASNRDGEDLAQYLRLDVDLPAVVRALEQGQGPLAGAARRFPGLRVLGQDPTETLLSFVCSGANSIIRISKSIALLCECYGGLIADVDSTRFCDFPRLEVLAATDPLEVRFACDLGFRSKALCRCAARLIDLGEGWLDHLRTLPHGEAHRLLVDLPGVGRKVADCALLFGLRHDDAVPVDTHIRAAARDLLGWEVASGSLTARAYQEIGERFRARYGRHAGWAQQYLFHLHRVLQTDA